MGKSNLFADLYHNLQDPHLVARFQHFCGVRETCSRSATSSAAAERGADRTHEHTNGACRRRAAGGDDSEYLAGIAAGEGGDVQTAAVDDVRTRVARSNVATSRGEEGEHPPRNGALVSAVGDAVSAGRKGRSIPTTGARTDRTAATQSEETPGSSGTVKPLRKNSLTGDAGQEFLIQNRFLYYAFTLGTELGNELFYITFFPFVTWSVDAFVSRRLIMVWVWVMYLGQCTKDLLGWSRPASPPVIKVEMFYNSEYSMPSTHAMSGTAIPFSLFFLTYGRWEDVIAGVLYSVLILVLFLPALDLIDGFNLTCRHAPLIIVCLHLGLGLFSFNLDTWSTSRGDTAQILGTGAGVALASHVNNRLGLMPDATPDQLPFPAPALNAGLVGAALVRLVLGVLVLMATRALMKAATIPVLCRVFGVPSDDVRKARQRMEVELPYRYIVYVAVGFNVLFLVPLLFSYTRLS
ncbi:sphingosine-1-phosphate phosphatase 1 isoform 2-T2 [Spinachia spinachia]